MARTRARDARPQRRPTRTGAFSLSGVALVGVLGWVALTDRDVRTTGLDLTSGAAWLASPARGLVTLIDGPSEGVIASIDLNTAGQVGVAQDGTSAFVTDDATGTVYRLDGATVEVAKAVRFGAAGSQLEVLTGTESAYVVDATARVATLVDDRELTVQSTVPLAARPGPNQTVVDAANRLWVVDADGSGLLRSDPDGGQQRTPISGSSVLAIAGGNAVAIDRAVPNPAVTALKPDGSAAEWPCRLPVRPGERAELLGDPDGDAVIAAIEQSGTLAVVDDSADCVSPVQLADPGSSFGALAMSDQFVFVPNHSTGSTLVVDLATASVVADIPLTDAGHDLELTVKDGVVFYNDLDSEKAGVLRLGANGRWEAGTPLQKYDPVTGEANGALTAEVPSSPTPPQQAGPPTDPAPAQTEPADPATQPPATPPPAGQPADGAPAVTANPPTTTAPPPAVTTPPPAAAPPPTTQRPPSTTPVTTPPPAATTTPPETSTTTTTTTPPPPSITIDTLAPVGVLTTGGPVTLSASASNADGAAWSWTITAGGENLPTGTDVGQYSGALPVGTYSAIHVSLTVGGVTREDDFPVSQGTTATSLDVAQPDATPFWETDTYEPAVSVVTTDGQPATGMVTLSGTQDGAPIGGFGGPATLDGSGSASWPGQGFPAGEVVLSYSYDGDATHEASSAPAAFTVEEAPHTNSTKFCMQQGSPGGQVYGWEFEIAPSASGVSATIRFDSVDGPIRTEDMSNSGGRVTYFVGAATAGLDNLSGYTLTLTRDGRSVVEQWGQTLAMEQASDCGVRVG